FSHRAGIAEQPLDRRGPERDQHLRADELDLFPEPRKTRVHFLRGGLAISRGTRRHVRTALEHVPDVNGIARIAHGLNDLREKLPGASHEWFTLRVFIRSRGLTDEHQPRRRIADTE